MSFPGMDDTFLALGTFTKAKISVEFVGRSECKKYNYDWRFMFQVKISVCHLRLKKPGGARKTSITSVYTKPTGQLDSRVVPNVLGYEHLNTGP